MFDIHYRIEHPTYLIKGIMLLFLAIFGNFVAETLSCQVQRVFTNNMLVKQLLVFFILYFTINFSNDSAPFNPFVALQISGIIYIFFILFTRMSVFFSTIGFLILTSCYISTNYIEYYEYLVKKDDSNKHLSKKIDILEKYRKYSLIVFIIWTLLGFLIYLYFHYMEYKKNWNFITFLFGKKVCNSLKNI
jgi:hypothetical protein